jgi:hypothetical protein
MGILKVLYHIFSLKVTSILKKTALIVAALILIAAIYFGQKYMANTQTYEESNPTGLAVINQASTTNLTSATLDWYISSTSPYSTSTVGQNNQSDLSPTQKLSQDIFVEYMKLKQSGNFNDQTKGDLIQSIVDKTGSLVSTVQFTMSDLKTTSDESAEALKKYGNELGSVFLNNSPGKLDNEIATLKNAVDNNDPTILKNLKPIIAAYKNMAQDMMAIVVPKAAAASHIDLANNFMTMSQSVETFTLMFTDAVSALAGIKQYSNTGPLMVKNIQALTAFFNSHSVKFTPGEPGYVFTHLVGV